MTWTIIGAVVVAVIIIALWIGINMRMLRQPEAVDNAKNRTAVAVPVSEVDAAVEAAIVMETEVETEVSHRPKAIKPVSPVLEVVAKNDPNRKMFERPAYPFRLQDAQVPIFNDPAWKQSFYRLTEDEKVLGWIAFHNDTLGAADRDYDLSFLEVLRNYRRSVERLRKEVGLSHVVETSVVADEGKVWFFTAVEETWFALFVDKDVDMNELSKRLLGPVLIG